MEHKGAKIIILLENEREGRKEARKMKDTAVDNERGE